MSGPDARSPWMTWKAPPPIALPADRVRCTTGRSARSGGADEVAADRAGRSWFEKAVLAGAGLIAFSFGWLAVIVALARWAG